MLDRAVKLRYKTIVAMKFRLVAADIHGRRGLMIPRDRLIERVRRALERSRVVALLGPRQCGKTTLARRIVPPDSVNYFDLEDPAHAERLTQPMSALERLRGTVVIDEVQRRPELFPVLRVLADRQPLPAKFLVLGSASPGLLKQSSESLAGRIERVPMAGLTLEEVGLPARPRHWLRGGFPLSFLAGDEEASWRWRREFVQTFLERDIPQLGMAAPPTRTVCARTRRRAGCMTKMSSSRSRICAA